MKTETTGNAPTKRRWLKRLAFLAVGLVVLLVIGWLVVTSEAFFKGVVLPRVGKAMNASITAEGASLSPFSQVDLRGLKVTTTGSTPLLAVNEVRARYHLTAMLGGTINVDEVLIDSPVVTVEVAADGKSNVDPLMQGSKEKTPAQSAGKAPQIDLKSFQLKNAIVHFIRHHADGTRDEVNLTGINITLDDLKNGAAGRLGFALNADAALNPPVAAQRGTMQLKHAGNYTFTLGADLVPTQISGSDQTDVTGATGAFEGFAGAGMDLQVETTASEVKSLALKFRKAGATLGALQVAGPFDAAQRTGKLNVALTGVDQQLLNLAGSLFGVDFGTTRISSSNVVEIAKGGTSITVNGQLLVADARITRQNQTTPTLQVNANYGLAVDTDKKSAVLQALNLAGSQDGRPLVTSELSKPMTIAWGQAAADVGDATLALHLTGLNLADWRPFLGGSVSGGTIDATVKVLSQAAGKRLSIELVSDVQNVTTVSTTGETTAISTKPSLTANIALNNGATAVNGQLAVAALRTRSGGHELRLPDTSATFDMTLTNQLLELKQLVARLAPSSRATNELSLTGRVDMSAPEAITGQLKLAADSLDLTPYYDLFTNAPAAAPAQPNAPAPAETEPAAMTLPFRDFTVEANVGRLYLREVEITNCQATVRLNGGQVTIKPVQLVLNGAPVTASADLDLGVAGFKYAVDFNASGVPLAPLVNSFQPERKGQIGGTVTATGQLQGTGVTGANLKKNLAGQFSMLSTNLNLSLNNARMPVIKSLINVIVAIPDAIRNPTAAVGSLLSGLVGAKQGAGSGVVDEFLQSPINAIVAQGKAGGGKIELQQAVIESAAFRGGATGTIDIANVLSNSIMQFPVSVELGRSLSDKLGLTPAGTPTNAAYVALPEFVRMKGSLGVPKPDVNYLVLAQLALKTGGGILGKSGGAATSKAEGALGVIGGLLGEKTTAGTNTTTTATNAPAGSPAAEIIRGLGDLLGGGKRSDSNQTPATPKQ